MISKIHLQDETRRTLITAAFAAALVTNPGDAWPTPSAPPGQLGDFDFLIGGWKVRHHRLVARLVGSTEWQDFDGTCNVFKLLDGQANVDDNVLHIPSGTYRGATIRLFNPREHVWALYWVDSRSANIAPPVFGGFSNGLGLFFGDDKLDGRSIRVRFTWLVDGPNRCRWEQAFSANQGATWETNWTMHFERSASPPHP